MGKGMKVFLGRKIVFGFSRSFNYLQGQWEEGGGVRRRFGVMLWNVDEFKGLQIR